MNESKDTENPLADLKERIKRSKAMPKDTVLQRATEYSVFMYDTAEERMRAKDDYFQGATEQRKLDVDKAVKWLKAYLYAGHINSGMDKPTLIKTFKQAMMKEEQING